MTGWAAYIRRLKQLLRRRGQSREDAEDLVQEAFLRLHTFLKDGHEVQKPEAFLTRIALNLAVDARRRDKRDRRDHFVAETVEELALQDFGPSPEEVFAAERRLIQIQQVLDTRVCKRTREIFFLHRLEGFTHDEIAMRMGMSVRTVEKHIARAVTAIWMERN
jgi:RNA polymerase sigma-70 factor (ECF subfamily)